MKDFFQLFYWSFILFGIIMLIDWIRDSISNQKLELAMTKYLAWLHDLHGCMTLSSIS